MSLKKQRGALSAEFLGYLVGIIAILIFVASQSPKIWDKAREIHFTWQANQIAQAVPNWKKGRTGFTGVSIAKVCASGELGKSVCGDSGDGKGTNIYGGDWDIRVNSGSSGLFDIVATIPQDTHKIASLADSVASSTRGDCTEASGCSSISKGTNSITMTY
ncbi:hypothetical protein DYB89_14730 [Vibrio cholerae]|nr:hypothetical protein [Vibrio cholerae]